MKQVEQEQVEWGYRHFDRKPTEITIKGGNTKQIKKEIQKKVKDTSQWKDIIKQTYEVHPKAAHLQGKNLYKFYQCITGS